MCVYVIMGSGKQQRRPVETEGQDLPSSILGLLRSQVPGGIFPDPGAKSDSIRQAHSDLYP